MSISGALNNALSGLTAAGLASETVANNVSNALTPGYAPRSLELAARANGGIGGVSVVGVIRNVDMFLLSDRRLASAELGRESVASDFLSRLETLIGSPDQAGSLSAALSNFENSLITAASRPDAPDRLDASVTAARDLASSLSRASDNVQQARSQADNTIASEVDRLNQLLKDVETLNGKIVAGNSNGQDVAALTDYRQQAIDEISTMVPVRVDQRENGRAAIYSVGGAILLDPSAATVEFSNTPAVTPYASIDDGTLSGLTINGNPVDTSGDKSPLRGGTLIANFTVRDETAVEAQAQLDAIARDLIERFSDPSLDPTLAAGDPGLFTDAGAAFNTLDEVGLASRISINPAVDPVQGGETWRLRDGMNAATPGAAGDATIIQNLTDALSAQRVPVSGDFGTNALNANQLMSTFLSQVSADRLQTDQRLAFATSQHDELVQMELRNGVDMDAELQRLILIEQVYAANSRIIQAIDEMLQTLERI